MESILVFDETESLRCTVSEQVLNEMCLLYPTFSRDCIAILVRQLVKEKMDVHLVGRTYYQFLGYGTTMGSDMRFVQLYGRKWM
jgi:hypothetical protein